MTDCVYIFMAPSLAMMQTRSRCFSSLRVRINDSVMLKFGCSSLKNNQSYVMKITMTSESPIVSPSEKGVINYYLHQKICTVICGNAIFTIGSSADLEILCSRLFSRLVNFFSFKGNLHSYYRISLN